MIEKGFSGIVLALLIIGILNLTFTVQPVQASATIYIRADGSIDPPSAPIYTADNVTYTFTGDINDSIIVERDDIVIDGMNHLLQGNTFDLGLDLSNRIKVTIKDLRIRNWDFGILLSHSTDCLITANSINANDLYGIYLDESSNNTISGNNIKNNDVGIRIEYSSNNTVSGNNVANNDVYGVHLYHSSNNCISGSNITANNDQGIRIEYSSNNTVSGNNVANNGLGIWLIVSSNHNSISENNITSNQYGIILSSSNNNITRNTLVDDGLFVDQGPYRNIVENNTVNSKPLVYLEDASNHVVVEAGQVILIRCNRITVKNLHISHTEIGIQLWHTNSTISGNNITNNYFGVLLESSHNNSISRNNIVNNGYSVYLGYSSKNNSISGNNMANNTYGIRLDDRSNCNSLSRNNITGNSEIGIWLSASSYNSISGNNIADNDLHGVHLYHSSNNRFYHNNFVYNAYQVYREGYANIWDNGYPSGGNYWSNYNGTDFTSGPYQNETDSDGIGDTPYQIDANNTDNYPLMGLFSSFNATSEFDVQTVCNSTISDFHFNGTAVSFNVTGEENTAGFCRICIPKALMNGTFRVFVDSTEILPPPEPSPWSNSTHNYLPFNYNHSTQEIVIIPESPSLLILPLSMAAIAIASIIHKRKHMSN